MLPLHRHDEFKKRGILGSLKEKVITWTKLILADKNSRNLLGFLLLNLTFAFVELFYGVWTNSLGLISDAFHMFFDCTGLLAGLVATVITKWKASEKFSYGFVRAEVLAGFINGLFLLFIAFFIASEAIERLVEPPEVKHERLLVVSILGFVVNLIGIFIFQHGGAGHGHSHGGDDGGHGHAAHDDSAHSHNNHGHAHDHHGHSHGGNGGGGSQIMKGVFLHILADTLGSVGVIVSAILMQTFGWMIADPICSICISLLIILSVYSLISDSVGILMQRQPKELDHLLPGAYNKVLQLEGVEGVQETHFWTVCSGYYAGGIKLEVSANADAKYVTSHAQFIFRGIGVTQMYVQLDYEHHKNTYQNLQQFY